MAQSAEDVQATALTLRFKHARITVLLFVEPLTPFSDVLASLLSSLQERYPAGIPSNSSTHALPTTATSIRLALPADPFNEQGAWTELALATAGSAESPRSMSLKDGSCLAFAFEDEEGEVEFEVQWPSYEDEYGDGEEELEEEDDGRRKRSRGSIDEDE